jgi:hypothetical protein
MSGQWVDARNPERPYSREVFEEFVRDCTTEPTDELKQKYWAELHMMLDYLLRDGDPRNHYWRYWSLLNKLRRLIEEPEEVPPQFRLPKKRKGGK